MVKRLFLCILISSLCVQAQGEECDIGYKNSKIGQPARPVSRHDIPINGGRDEEEGRPLLHENLERPRSSSKNLCVCCCLSSCCIISAIVAAHIMLRG